MKIAVLTPCYSGSVNMAFCLSLLETIMRVKKSECVFLTNTNNSILPAARNTLVAKAMAWGADKIVFIDDDISWKSDDFQKLVLAPERVVAGVYAKKKQTEGQATSFAVSALPAGFEPDHRGLVEVDGAATGFIRIDREVFEALKSDCVKLHDDSLDADSVKHLHEWFAFARVQREKGMMLEGEDYNFCRKARAAGFRVFVDPSIHLGHHSAGFKFGAHLPAQNIL